MSPPWDDLREALRREPGAARALRQRGRVLDALEAGQRPRPARLVALGAALTLAAGVAAWRLWPAPAPRAHDAQGREVQVGAPLHAGAEPLELRFDEGSALALLPGAVARVTTLAADRVEVQLDEGRLDATVTPGTGRAWRYLAGDYAVRVTGTQLSVRWEPASGAFDVSVSRGSVEVTGPGLEPPVAVHAGESLHRERQAAAPSWPLAPAAGAAESATPAAPAEAPRAPSAAASRLAPSPPTVAAAERPPGPPPQSPAEVPEAAPVWRTLLEAGRRREALDAFEPAPPAALEDGDALALGDAARLEHRADLAQRLLGEVFRHRGPDAAEAAFLLGRIEADAERHAQAVAWFGRAVVLAPDGAFAEQSRGRLLEAQLQLNDAGAARAAAEDYLRHHPSGAWAGLATRVTHAGDSGP